jgi:phosphoglycerate-specific signal transduction histidine kinase
MARKGMHRDASGGRSMLNAIAEQWVATGGWGVDNCDEGIPKKVRQRNILDALQNRCRTGERDRQLRPVEIRGFAEVLLENTRLREEMRWLQADLACICQVIASGELGASLAHEIKQPIAAL